MVFDAVAQQGGDLKKFVAFELRGDFWQSYICKGDSESQKLPIMLGLGVKDLQKLLKSVPDASPLRITLADCRGVLEFLSTDSEVQVKATAKLIDLSREFLPIPAEASYDTEIDLPSKAFQNIMKDLSVADGDSVVITLHESEKDEDDEIVPPCIEFRSESASKGMITHSFRSGSGGVSSWESTAISQEFSMKFLKDHATEFCQLCETLTLSLGPSLPLRVKFPVGRDSCVVFFLGPREAA
eukprot:Polyplicarium_translucidae@DN3393_c0_g2_i10.p1